MLNNDILERCRRLVTENVFCLFNAGFAVFHDTPEGEQAYDEAFEAAYERFEAREVEHIESACGVEVDELTSAHLAALEGLGDYGIPWADLFDDDEFDADQFKERLRDSFFESNEPMQFWLVDSWLARKLQDQGEIVIKVYDLNIWARCQCGQALYVDYVFQSIATELLHPNT